MRVNQCDACGNTYQPYSGKDETGNGNGLLFVDFNQNGRYEKRGYFDLCPDCARKLALFLNIVDETNSDYEQMELDIPQDKPEVTL